MNTRTINIIRSFAGAFLGIAVILFSGCASVARASGGNVVFDQSDDTLSVSGNCTQSFVLVIIKNASDGSIWGSSNPPCVNGAYSYSIVVPSSDENGQMFTVDTEDGGVSPQTAKPMASVVIPAPAPVTAPPTIVADTSTMATSTDDISFLDATLNQFFGIIADVGDDIQNFGTVVADTVKASVVAAVNIFGQQITVLPGGSITVPDGADQMSGEATLSALASEVFVPNTEITSSSKIFITPTTATAMPLTVVEKEDGVGFGVGVLQPVANAITFDWLVLQTYSTGDESSGQSIVPPPPAEEDLTVPVPPSPSSTDQSSISTDQSSTDQSVDQDQSVGQDASSTDLDTSSTIASSTTDVATSTDVIATSTDTIDQPASDTVATDTTDTTDTTDVTDVANTTTTSDTLSIATTTASTTSP